MKKTLAFFVGFFVALTMCSCGPSSVVVIKFDDLKSDMVQMESGLRDLDWSKMEMKHAG